MSHSYHEGEPGFSPAQILHDGCSECEFRGRHVSAGVSSLDRATFAHAWQRAADWNRMGGGVDDVSETEHELLSALWAVQLQLQALGWPLGEVPLPSYWSLLPEGAL